MRLHHHEYNSWRWTRLCAGSLIIGFMILSVTVLSTEAARASTLNVTNCHDSGAGSLRDAVANAPAGTTLGLPSSCHLITLTTGTIDITKNHTIKGPGATKLAVSGNRASTVFSVASGVTATISKLTIENGNNSSGGGIVNYGTLKVSKSTLSNNSALGAAGGGILNAGTLEVSKSTLSNNSSKEGGGIDNYGTLTVSRTTVSDNSATDGYGGGIFNNNQNESFGAMLTISKSTISNNAATGGDGGGIYNLYGTVIIFKSTVSKNRTPTNTACTDHIVIAFCGGDGGGIMNLMGTLTVSKSTVSDNSATNNTGCTGNSCGGYGGGIYNANTLTVSGSSLPGNIGIANYGTSIYSETTPTITNSQP